MWLIAQQVAPTTDPVSYTPLGIVALVVTFLLWRMKDSDSDNRKRIAELEVKLETAMTDNAVQHSLKHRALGQVAAGKGIIDLTRKQARKCDCGAMAPVLPLIDLYKEEYH